jgi:hypothetical protein
MNPPLSAPGENAGWMGFLSSIATPAIGAWAFVQAAVLIAPKGKRVVGIVAAVLAITPTMVVLVMAISNGEFGYVLPLLAACVGAAIAAFGPGLRSTSAST